MNVVIKVNEKIKEKMIKHYKNYFREKTPPYAVFQAQQGDTIITLYESGKVMFQGPTAFVDADMWKELMGIKDESEKNAKEKDKYYNTSCVGSDEVGTGDYFGPIIVTASYLKKEDIEKLEQLGVCDSKKLTDEKILKIAKELVKIVKYKSIILSIEEYNEKYNKETNMNKIKAIMHNKALGALLNDLDEVPDYIIVDEFAKENRYYGYLEGISNIVSGITFITKAEDKNLAVASSSIISRYLFLKEMDKLSDTYHIPLPKGAGSNVDSIGEELVEKYGRDVLLKVSKRNFSNTQRILKTRII